MGIESLMLCGIFFEPGADIPLYGNSEMIERGRLHQKANDVGTSRFQTFLADPQPLPDLIIRTPSTFQMIDTQGIQFNNHDSVSYHNRSGKLLGGITQLNWDEMMSLYRKHNE